MIDKEIEKLENELFVIELNHLMLLYSDSKTIRIIQIQKKIINKLKHKEQNVLTKLFDELYSDLSERIEETINEQKPEDLRTQKIIDYFESPFISDYDKIQILNTIDDNLVLEIDCIKNNL